jgi:hypothetical protein
VPDVSPPTYTKRDQGYWPEDLIRLSAQHRFQLSTLADILRPTMWFGGHHHKRLTGSFAGTEYHVMGRDGDPFGEWAGVFDLDNMTQLVDRS